MQANLQEQMLAWLKKNLARIHSDEILVLLPLLVAAVGVWGFIELAENVNEGSTRNLDEWVLKAMRRADDPATPIGPAWMHEVGRDLTALGGIAIMFLVIGGVAGFLLFQRKYRAMPVVLAASSSGLAVSGILKHSYARPRPSIVPHLSISMTSSFPSGHSMISAVVYLTLGALLARTVKDRPTRVYCMVMAVAVTFLVGISRVYLGVHYPTDVLAGWTAGLVWALVCWSVAGYLQKRGKIEQPMQST